MRQLCCIHIERYHQKCSCIWNLKNNGQYQCVWFDGSEMPQNSIDTSIEDSDDTVLEFLSSSDDSDNEMECVICDNVLVH